MHRHYLIEPGERPYYPSVAEHLWGAGCGFDSDGNDDEVIPGGWTELTVILRPGYDARVDVDPLDEFEPLVLVIRSDDETLARSAAEYLQACCGGTLSRSPPQRP